MGKGTLHVMVAGVLALAVLAVLAPAAEAFELKAGTAKAVITPDLDKPRVTVMGVPFDGLTHDLYARALVLNDGKQRLVIVTYDLNCLDVATPILRKRCRDELGIEAAYLLLLGTHNHAAPIQIVPGNFDYGRWLAETIFTLCQEAIANEQGPVRLEFGWDYAYFVKSVGKAPIDYEVQLLKVSRGGEPVALFFTHPTHPLQVSKTKLGVGHPGYAVDAVEQAAPGALALYADACGGNQFTVHGMFKGLETVQALGQDLAEVVLSISKRPMRDVTGPLSSALEVVSLSLARPQPREVAERLARRAPTDIGFVPYPHPDRWSNWIRALLRHHKEGLAFPAKTTDMVCTDEGFLVHELELPREFPCRYEEVIVAKIGPMVLVAMQGEVCAPIGMRIKDAFRYETPIMVSAYMGEHNLYIPTRELVRLGMYQAKVLQEQYACPVAWAPTVEDEMVAAVRKMIKKALGDSG